MLELRKLESCKLMSQLNNEIGEVIKEMGMQGSRKRLWHLCNYLGAHQSELTLVIENEIK